MYETVTEAGPSAFANIHENYYYVFVVCSAFFLVVAYFYFPYVIPYPPIYRSGEIGQKVLRVLILDRETKQKTLEEIAASFGDKVVESDETASRIRDDMGGPKPGEERVEVIG